MCHLKVSWGPRNSVSKVKFKYLKGHKKDILLVSKEIMAFTLFVK